MITQASYLDMMWSIFFLKNHSHVAGVPLQKSSKSLLLYRNQILSHFSFYQVTISIVT